jgi:hypothetical protein
MVHRRSAIGTVMAVITGVEVIELALRPPWAVNFVSLDPQYHIRIM